MLLCLMMLLSSLNLISCFIILFSFCYSARLLSNTLCSGLFICSPTSSKLLLISVIVLCLLVLKAVALCRTVSVTPLAQAPWSPNPSTPGISPVLYVPSCLAKLQFFSSQLAAVTRFAYYGCTGQGLLPVLLRGLAVAAMGFLVAWARTQPC